MRVDVYWNLNRRTFSVRHRGKVVAYRDMVMLQDVRWVVQPSGQARVRREQKKNVHAFARGEWDPMEPVDLTGLNGKAVRYDPYKHDTFVYDATGEPAVESGRVLLVDGMALEYV